MLKVKDIYKVFDNKVILNGISFNVENGSVTTLIGPSGTGKTTLLRCINLLEHPEKGEVTIDDTKVDISSSKKSKILELRRKTAMVFQQYNLFNNLTVEQNVVQPQIIVKKIDKDKAIRNASYYLSQVDMEEYVDHYPSQLSGGQQQRVSIARALAINPDVILFDEPTSALDPELSEDVFRAIEQVSNMGIAVVIATHEMNFAEKVSDHVIFMENGQIIEEGSPDQIFNLSTNERTQSFLKKVH